MRAATRGVPVAGRHVRACRPETTKTYERHQDGMFSVRLGFGFRVLALGFGVFMWS